LCQTFRTEKEARAWARKVEAEIELGRAPQRQSGLTVAKAVEAFRELRENAGRPIKDGSNEVYMLRHLEDPDGIGNVRIEALTPAKLAEWCRTRADDGAGPYTIGMEVSKLATVIKYAGISLHMALPDVVGAARPLLEYGGLIGPGEQRDRRPSADELAKLLELLSPTVGDFVRFAVATAMRRGEICRIRWADVDEARRCVLIRDRKHPRRKAGNHQLVPLLDKTGLDAWAILHRQPKIDARIFPLEPETVSDAFAAACKSAGIVDLHLHDLRHEGTSRLFEAGLSIDQVALVTGHRDWRSLRRYTHVRPESLHLEACGNTNGGRGATEESKGHSRAEILDPDGDRIQPRR
jgi:integrase